MRQFARPHVPYLVVGELRPLLAILGMRFDVDSQQSSKPPALPFLRQRPRQGRHVAVGAFEPVANLLASSVVERAGDLDVAQTQLDAGRVARGRDQNHNQSNPFSSA